MSEVYGAVVGNRGKATRQGSKESGIRAAAQSWEGSVITELYQWQGEKCVRITINEGSTDEHYSGNTLFNGTLAELKELAAEKEREG